MSDERKAAETKHSPEPWRTYADGCFVLDAGGRTLTVTLPDMSAVFREAADARRIVACVNACRSLPTSALEAGALGEALDAALALMTAYDAIRDPDASVLAHQSTYNRARAALRRVGRRLP